ncbi:hypothetical protein G9A89_015727 [Geosiphon pyriformis]|nr:hypothetical protein G9A89_015727 [Geosiphon pyriformis]
MSLQTPKRREESDNVEEKDLNKCSPIQKKPYQGSRRHFLDIELSSEGEEKDMNKCSSIQKKPYQGSRGHFLDIFFEELSSEGEENQGATKNSTAIDVKDAEEKKEGKDLGIALITIKKLKQKKRAKKISRANKIATHNCLGSLKQRLVKKLSVEELGERELTEDIFIDTSQFLKLRSLDNMTAFIKRYIPNHWNLLKPPLFGQQGAPLLLILTLSRERATNIIRVIKTEGSIAIKNETILKLFSKKLKLQGLERFLRNNSFNIAVGTLNRTLKLLRESDSLRLFRLKHILIETSWRDEKKRTIFHVPEYTEDLVQLLGMKKINQRLKAVDDEDSKTRVLFY